MRNLFLVLLALTLISCDGETPTTKADETRWPSSEKRMAPFDIGSVMRQVHFAFRLEGELYTGGDTNYAVKVEKEGVFHVTPIHYPNGKRAGDQEKILDPSEEIEWMKQGATHEEPQKGTPATFRTVRISDRVLGTPRLFSTVNGTVELSYDEVVEKLENTDNGVEQSWRFAKKPVTTGDLAITVAVGRLDYIGTTDHGLHFAEERSRLGLRYGVGTWIDANGAKTTIVPQWRNGAITLTVPRSILENSVYPAILDPTIGPEFGMDEPVYAPGWHSQWEPSVSFDGTNYLVVWNDARDEVNYHIYGARVSKAGVVLDPSGIVLSAPIRTQQFKPVAAFDGTNYLVVWQDYRNMNNHLIYGTRVSKAGEVLEPNGIRLNENSVGQYYPSIAFDGTNYLVIWSDQRDDGGNIYGTRVSTAGTILDQNGILISSAANTQWENALSFDGTNYLAAWRDDRTSNGGDIYVTRISKAGTVLDPSGIAVTTATQFQLTPEISFDGTNYLVVWRDQRNNDNDIYGARVSKAGTVLDPTGIAISTATNYQYVPSVAFDGTNYMVVWADERTTKSTYRLYGTRVSSEGVVLDPSGFLICPVGTNQFFSAMAFDGDNYMVVWENSRTGSVRDIFGTRLSKEGVVLDPSGIAMSKEANIQTEPAVAFDQTNYLVVWQDFRNGSDYDIWGVRVSVDGDILDPSGIAISSVSSDQKAPAVAFDGENYLVAWEDSRNGTTSDIYGTRVSKTGSVLSPSGKAITTATNNQYAPAIAFDGTNYLTVWYDFRNASHYDIYGSRISTTGNTLDPSGILINSAARGQDSPVAAFDGTNYLVVWRDYRSGSSYTDIYGSRVTQNGEVLDTDGFIISTSANSQAAPAIAFDGTNYLVVWEDFRSLVTWDIYGARVTKTGSLINFSNFAISTAAGDQRYPSVVFDGVNYLVVWQDERTDTFLPGIYGIRVAPGATVVGTEILISADGYKNERPAISPASNGTALIVYQHFDPRYEYYSKRIVGRFYYSGEVGSLCDGGEACLSTCCVGGFCAELASCLSPDDTPISDNDGVEPDIDTTVEPDDGTEPVDDENEPSDDNTALPDESIDDTADIDQDTVIFEENGPVEEDVVSLEEDEVVTDDGLPQDLDTAGNDAADVQTDEDNAVPDTAQPDETVDDAVDEISDLNTDSFVEDNDTILPDEQTVVDAAVTDADNDKTKVLGCSCSVVF